MKKTTCVLTLVVALSAGTSLWAGAPEGRYTISADTVKDEKTHLIWQRVVPSLQFRWNEANDYCASLDLAGLPSGWRLPKKKELESLVDRRAVDPSIDRAAFPGTPSDSFFAGTCWIPEDCLNYAWSVDFATGSSVLRMRSDSLRVRCVHD